MRRAILARRFSFGAAESEEKSDSYNGPRIRFRNPSVK
jgi:hypothetical protein